MKKFLLLSVVLVLLITTGKAQLTVTDEPGDTAFIYSLAGPGVSISNLHRNCADGATGYFNSVSANVGIDSGIILTTGAAISAIGPNNISGAGIDNTYPGDDDLSLSAGVPTQNACGLEFDMTVASDTLKLSYVFGSEEYLEFVFGFNDIFAFYLSGPGIVDGDEPDTVNIAMVPGTDLPVSIFNINDMVNSSYYTDNGDGITAPYSSDPYYIQYDGFTTVLQAAYPVTAGETYHMKLVIADALDGIYDSGVFLKTGSLGSLRLLADTFGDGDGDHATENCSNGYIKFTRAVVSDEPLVLDYHIAGSAINGVDYESIPDQIIIPGGDSSATISIVPADDAVSEGDEYITLYLYNPESNYVYDSVTIYLDDAFTLSNFSSAAETSTTYDFSDISGAGVSWLWDFGDGTTATTENSTHTFATTGVYNVCLTVVNAQGCTASYCKQLEVGTNAIGDIQPDDNYFGPNPVEDILTMAIPANYSGDLHIELVNSVGQFVRQVEVSDRGGKLVQMDLSDVPTGIYFVRLHTATQSMIKQIEVK